MIDMLFYNIEISDEKDTVIRALKPHWIWAFTCSLVWSIQLSGICYLIPTSFCYMCRSDQQWLRINGLTNQLEKGVSMVIDHDT